MMMVLKFLKNVFAFSRFAIVYVGHLCDRIMFLQYAEKTFHPNKL